ncbi:MAG: hypothetical protein M3P51_03450 [Chloroflexota bacterium]|nr:hypothetical protein [Chloroflexota bacterium]
MRTARTLTEGWLIRQLPSHDPDVEALTRAAASPDGTWLRARIPAQVHDVLLEHGVIADPHIGRNAAECAWVGERDWAYAFRFTSPEGAGGPVWLRFSGLDTLASAYLNGSHIGSFDNMFRQYRVDIREHLNPPGKENVLLILFSSPMRFIEGIEQPPEHAGRIAKHKYLRKAANDFTTYLGARPHFVKVGLYRDVLLDAADRAWIEDTRIGCELSPDHETATLCVEVETGGVPASLVWSLEDPAGTEVTRGTISAREGVFTIQLDRPRLWWPRTHGTPDLYGLRIDLLLGEEEVDSHRESIGIRDVRPVLSDADTGEARFRFEVNGMPIFLKGANWIPVEGMTHCWDHERAMRLLDLAEHAGMNVLRVWGGGYVPPEEFYDECDRRGILVWQDFMFEYGMHPAGYPEFDENVRAEAEGIVRGLRNHPCILLWVGGNENYMGWDFQIGGEPTIGRELFEGIISEVCARLDGTRHYHPSSPYGGHAPNWPLEGDWHDYTWQDLSPFSSAPLFASETGRASPPALPSMRRFLDAEDVWPSGHDPAVREPGQAAWPPMWGYRSVDGSWEKVGDLGEYCDPKTPEELVRALGTAHGEYLRRQVERHRRGVPDGEPDGGRRCWGHMVWRLNDAWPITYYSVVDYYLEPKIAYYFLRRAFAPVLVCFERATDELAVWVVNDSAHTLSGELVVRRMSMEGGVRAELGVDVALDAGASRRCLDTVGLGRLALRRELLHTSFLGKEATYLPMGERHLHLPQARLEARTTGGGIELVTDTFARQVVLETPVMPGALFGDNYFDLAPGARRVISVPAEASEVRVRAYNADEMRVRRRVG